LKTPGFLLVTVLTLAIGIAANTAVFSWIDTVLLRPIPGVSASRELVAFETLTPNGEFVTTSYADYLDYRDRLKLLVGLTVAQPRAFSVGDEERSERVWGELVAGNYFSVLGVRPLIGRTFSPEESGDAQGAYPVAVISEALWRRRFNADPGILGRTIRANRQQLTVIGVVSNDFRGTIPGLVFEMWAPATMGHALNFMPEWMMRDRKTRSFIAVARLGPGVTIAQARAEIQGAAENLARQHPNTNRGIRATVLPIMESHFGAQSLLLEPLRILMGVGIVVLLIVCANVANLLMARSTARRKEFSLRMSLGAGRLRIARQLLTETLLLGLAATAVGVPLAIWASQSLELLVPAGTLPVLIRVKPNADILLFLLAACLGATLMAGLIPAWQAVRGDVNENLKEGGRSGTASAGSQRIRGLLVASEVALALVALIGAGLFARSFQSARRIYPGFEPKQVLVSHVYLSTAGYAVPERVQFCRNLRARLEAQPGIEKVSYADMIPLGFNPGPWEDLEIAGYVPGPAENLKIYRNLVAPGFFDLLKIPLLEGRDFTEQDDYKSMRVMIVNETFVRRFIGKGNPIGVKVRGWGDWFTIVGVVRDSKYHAPNEPATPYFYVPFQQVYRADLDIAFYVRTAGDVNQALPVIRREVAQMDPNVGVFDAMPMSEHISASLFGQRVAASLLSALGGLALLLAGVGLYSVIAYSISQRTQEIGIRMALGASTWDVLGMVVRQGMGVTAVGIAAGVAAAIAVTRLASGLLVGVSATDPLIFLGAAVFLAIVALIASYVPAMRASRIDPNAALRRE
jgi:predicted permease